MKTPSLTLQPTETRIDPLSSWVGFDSAALVRHAARWLVGLATAAGLVFGAILAAMNPALDQYLSAVIWGAGFVFFALALDTGIRRIMPRIFTGLALPVLAVLGTEVAVEFSVLAAALIGAWVALWIIRRA